MPFYHDISKKEWSIRIEKAYKRLGTCDLCPRECGVDRLKNETGFCGADGRIKVSSIFPHHGEEPVISGSRGSGTIFFSHCILQCIFCQNYKISHKGFGEYISVDKLAEEMIVLQERGCHNINLVTPTHYIPQIIHAISLAAEKGLNLPIVYNTGGYESMETLKLLDGIVDIYLPDVKYSDNNVSGELSACGDYVIHNRASIKEMWRQVGPLVTDPKGVAVQGLIVRHLVLPENNAGTSESMRWLAETLGQEVAVSMMAQYSPLCRAGEYKQINRKITREEYFSAVESFKDAGLSEGWLQKWQDMDDRYIIDFINRKKERLI